MGEVKRWTVTYTKHVKQKRKSYQDGFLHLLPNNNKVMLYDDGEQLLDSKFLTKDEAVKSGGSLTFASFLVDIGDLDNNRDPIFNPNIKSECDIKHHEKTRMPQGEKSRHTFISRKPNAAGRKTNVCLSPSQKIIREFRKNEELKYGAHSPSPTTPSSREWEALYTTQLTQKAKKYHDGFIRMITCGTRGRQIILYDSSKNQIDKRFMKKEEAIDSGASLTFDGHLVDIGDPTGINKDDADVKTHRGNSSIEQSEMLAVAGCHWQKSARDFPVLHAKRSKESALMNHGSGNSIVIGEPRGDVCSTICIKSSNINFGFDKVKQKNLASRSSLRDANQILSIMRKPITQENQDTVSTIEDTPVQQGPLSSSEVVQLHGDRQAFDNSLQVDQCQVMKIVEKHNNEKTADEGHSSTFSESHCNSLETPGSTQGNEILGSHAFESPHKSKNTGGSSVVHGRPAVLQSSKGADSIDGNSPVGNETTTQQPSTKLPETDPESKVKTASARDMSRWFGNPVGNKMKKSLKTDESDITLECPSFDLGI